MSWLGLVVRLGDGQEIGAVMSIMENAGTTRKRGEVGGLGLWLSMASIQGVFTLIRTQWLAAFDGHGGAFDSKAHMACSIIQQQQRFQQHSGSIEQSKRYNEGKHILQHHVRGLKSP